MCTKKDLLDFMSLIYKYIILSSDYPIFVYTPWPIILERH